MRRVSTISLVFLVCNAAMSSKDKSAKVSFHEMALGMRDAFNCGVVVEEYLHGKLKDKADEYHKERNENNCDYVESVLNTLQDQNALPSNQ